MELILPTTYLPYNHMEYEAHVCMCRRMVATSTTTTTAAVVIVVFVI